MLQVIDINLFYVMTGLVVIAAILLLILGIVFLTTMCIKRLRALFGSD